MTEAEKKRRAEEWLLAARIGNVARLEELLAQDADLLQTRNAAGMTALMLAALYKRREAALFLQQAGGNVDDVDDMGRTVLMWVAYIGRANMVSLLLQMGADPDLRDHEGRQAGDITSYPAIKKLLQEGRAARAAEERAAIAAIQKQLKHRAPKFKLKPGGPR